jgi:L-ribulokinase
MVPAPAREYKPVPENVRKYRELYSVYRRLHDLMSEGENNAMKQLRELQRKLS